MKPKANRFLAGRMAAARRSFGDAKIIILATLLATLMVVLGSLWSIDKQYRLQEEHQRSLAAGSVQSVSREIAALLVDMRRNLVLFGDNNKDLLGGVSANPTDAAATTHLKKLLSQHFPDHYAYSLTTAYGELLVDDFGETIGDLCQHEIQEFAWSNTFRPIIHPGPGAYHFDLMVPWSGDRENGILFVSFKPDRLAHLLAEAQLPGHRLMLAKRDQPGLIEVTGLGSRDKLGERTHLDVDQAKRLAHLGAQTEVPETGWLLVSLPGREVDQALRDERRLRTATFLILLMLAAGAVILATLWRERHRRRHDEQKRLAAAVFDSAQEGIAITDLAGNFVAVNQAFSAITEYSEEEALGQNARILRSDRHDEAFFKQLWNDLASTGQWQGEIWDRRKSGEVYQEWLSISTVRNDEGIPVNYVATYTDISRIKHAQSHLERLAHHDILTGLPNRILMYSRLEHAIVQANRSRSRLAVMFLDLDRFKQVNDRYGHAAGDEVLKRVASQISGRLRESDTLARLGGDEFVVLLEEVGERKSVEAVARELIALVGHSMVLTSGHAVNIGLSVGISLYPDNGADINQLMSRADEAMYRAKEAGRNTLRFSA